ncbi:nuclease A inhibitor family protein [Crocosphaera sp. UHCC 0190]|uniref:nuclease A inhibitor family protein n=1 Tax=Crocosphaera sp. UHCC 0190 TaxID=3110246 RepID=UPI002B215EA3|nr:nuclease A inhibitor family protein [Crocosphaera sp. UHCC 0190]MEA5511745.1 nuclease A inhibitor family protein [Crocosphaera sp. UHCC 0190]
MKASTELLNQLNTLTDGLLWPSEADYPFEVFVWDDLAITPEQLRLKTGHSPDTAIKTMPIDDFFCPCTTEQDWHNEEEKAEVKRYQELVSFLKENLEDVKVYKLGKCEIDVYIIGQCSGQLIGLQTKVIET